MFSVFCFLSSETLESALTLYSDPLLVNATLNSLSVLIRSRQSVGNKIINAVMNFIPAKQVRGPITPTIRVAVKSMERTARSLMINIMKRSDCKSPATGRETNANGDAEIQAILLRGRCSNTSTD